MEYCTELTNDNTIHGHVLASYLKPTTRGGTQIDTASRRLEESEFLVELNEFES
jgi:hypothetical protein